MLDGYSVMEWVTFGGVFIIIFLLIGAIVHFVGNHAILRKQIQYLSKENERLSQLLSKENERLSQKISSERTALSKENDSIIKGIEYIVEELLKEQLARENLYKTTDRAKELLETMDMMKEAVMQNAQLNATITQSEVENQELINQNHEIQRMLGALNNVSHQLSTLEGSRDSEKIEKVFRNIKCQFSDFL